MAREQRKRRVEGAYKFGLTRSCSAWMPEHHVGCSEIAVDHVCKVHLRNFCPDHVHDIVYATRSVISTDRDPAGSADLARP